ncbi:SapC protein [Luteimonas cucumeris]|uniref:SapC protein n=1 Tax=Luteimonas cucumeris TaxID=985012 RepID=A0A562KX48_9GAMM|nr:SapC family protein [Luteimonas cucumeris]TWH99981.1 SapC protein [Luteimonas cucumeris]
MSHPVLLNNIDHHDLRVITARGAAYGDDTMSVPTFFREFRDLQAHYPIVFQPTADGGLQPLALLGLRQGENLFLQGERWDAHYLPLAIERLPFLIGIADDEPMIHVDLDHPRVRRGEAATGEPLFLQHGGTAPLLDRIASVLRTLHDGLHDNAAFIAALLHHQLLEPFMLDITLDDQSHIRLSGFHTIHEQRVRQLDGAALQALSQAGYLEAMYMALASMSQLRGLIERMNCRVAGR